MRRGLRGRLDLAFSPLSDLMLSGLGFICYAMGYHAAFGLRAVFGISGLSNYGYIVSNVTRCNVIEASQEMAYSG